MNAAEPPATRAFYASLVEARPGLHDPVFDAQRTFRAVLEAFARPGLNVAVNAEPEHFEIGASAMAVLLSLLDPSTSLWISPSFSGNVTRHIQFHTGTQLATSAMDADHVVLAEPDELVPMTRFLAGTHEDPHRSALVLVRVERFDGGESVLLSGPGIIDSCAVAPFGFHGQIWDEFIQNNARFPIGIDVLVSDGHSVMGIPRSTTITRRCIDVRRN